MLYGTKEYGRRHGEPKRSAYSNSVETSWLVRQSQCITSPWFVLQKFLFPSPHRLGNETLILLHELDSFICERSATNGQPVASCILQHNEYQHPFPSISKPNGLNSVGFADPCLMIHAQPCATEGWDLWPDRHGWPPRQDQLDSTTKRTIMENEQMAESSALHLGAGHQGNSKPGGSNMGKM